MIKESCEKINKSIINSYTSISPLPISPKRVVIKKSTNSTTSPARSLINKIN